MAITANDIKLLESERMADSTDGGGRRTSRVIPDGVAGNIFPKVSRLDSVYGRVNLRKVFGAVQTADTDTYAGAHAVITDAPDNAKIHCTLFSTASEWDTRTAARDRIESYVTSGPESRLTLLGRQLTGQQTVVAYQRVEEPLPEVGDVYCLSTESGSTVTAQQYFRVQTVEAEIRTFAETIGSNTIEFKRRVVTLGTGVALRYDFNGHENATQLTNVTRPAKLRSTTFVDAARYFGIRPLAEAAAANALAIKVDTIYSPIVPTTNRETPLSNVQLGGASAMEAIKASQRTETLAASGGWANGASYRTLRGIKPGSLTINASSTTATDDKLGNINSTAFTGAVDYETGLITRTGGNVSASTYSAVYTPAVAAAQVAHSAEVKITIANRGTVYVFTLNPLPAPGSAIVDFRALGKWYRLRDKGDGTMGGDDPAYGVGTIDYATGALVLTLGSLPDIDSSILVSFGSPVHYVVRAGATSNASASVTQRIMLPDLPVSPDSVAVTYTSGGVNYTANDNASGVISGGGVTGSVNYTTGEVLLNYTTRLPDALTSVSVAYNQTVATVEGESAVMSGTFNSGASINLASTVQPGSLSGNLFFENKSVYFKDNGSGLLLVPGGQSLGDIGTDVNKWFKGVQGAIVDGDQIVGTVNYSTGALVVNTSLNAKGNKYAFTAAVLGALGGEWLVNAVTASVSSGAANIGWRTSGISTVDEAKTAAFAFADAPLRFPLRTSIGDSIVPGSLLFSISGKTYIDRNGILYADVSNATGSGTTAGSVDYSTGDVELSYWATGAAMTVAVDCCLSIYGEYSAVEAFFRTSGAPIRPGSFYVQATSIEGVILSGQSNSAGVITGTKVAGNVDQDTGVVKVSFGEMVTAAGNESEPWYDADLVVGGMIWKPEQIIPSTLQYNAVVLSNLPLNADILGLDPVRLPSDGRVPIYRAADVVVIHNTQSYALPNPAVAGATYSVGRTDLSEVWLVDQNGVKVPSNQYVGNLLNGTVTMSAELTLTGLVQPLIAKHRVEDLALVSDVQINGDLTLTAPLSRSYPAGTSFVSSAVLFGDMNARVTNVFDLLAFSAWSDTPGAGATAEYNLIDYPVEVMNNGALSERWRINFTSTTGFQVIGENLGVIATGTTGADCAPTNALTGNPYFVIRAAGWGAGWSAGNQLRFNTVSAAAPIWIARTVLPGATLEGDAFSLQMRGDVDAE